MGGTANDFARAFGDGRVTPQRLLIAEQTGALPGAFTIDDLASAVRRADPTLGAATVYRAVAAMAASGWLERVGERDGSALFARCDVGGGHHHHVVCDACGRVAATKCPVALDGAAGARDDGFVITRHEVTLYGLCPECADKPAGTGG